MHKPISWIDRGEDGSKRLVEAMIARQRIDWKIRMDTQIEWDDPPIPTEADWGELLQKVKNRYQRNNVAYSDLELVTRLHKEALGLTE